MKEQKYNDKKMRTENNLKDERGSIKKEIVWSPQTRMSRSRKAIRHPRRFGDSFVPPQVAIMGKNGIEFIGPNPTKSKAEPLIIRRDECSYSKTQKTLRIYDNMYKQEINDLDSAISALSEHIRKRSAIKDNHNGR